MPTIVGASRLRVNCFCIHSSAFWANVNNASNAHIIPSVVVTFLDSYDFYQIALYKRINCSGKS